MRALVCFKTFLHKKNLSGLQHWKNATQRANLIWKSHIQNAIFTQRANLISKCYQHSKNDIYIMWQHVHLAEFNQGHYIINEIFKLKLKKEISIWPTQLKVKTPSLLLLLLIHTQCMSAVASSSSSALSSWEDEDLCSLWEFWILKLQLGKVFPILDSKSVTTKSNTSDDVLSRSHVHYVPRVSIRWET